MAAALATVYISDVTRALVLIVWVLGETAFTGPA